MAAFTLSGDLRATAFSAIRASLVLLGRAITVHNDVDLEWHEPGIVDVLFESTPGLEGTCCDYLVSGTINDQAEAAVARVNQLGEALDCQGIAYRLELDCDDGREQSIVFQSRAFPGY